MKKHFGSNSTLIGLFGAWALLCAEGAWANGCDPHVDVLPNALKQNQSGGCGGACGEQNKWIHSQAQDYARAVQAACGKANDAIKSLSENNQKNSQSNAGTVYTEGSTAMGGVVTKARQIRQSTADTLKRNLNRLSSEARSATPDPRLPSAISGLRNQFTDSEAFNTKSAPDNTLTNTSAAGSKSMADNSAEFMHNLYLDAQKREKTKASFDEAAGKANNNANNSGPAEKKEDGKGMDMGQLAQLAGPLAGLAGMANQQKQNSADSGLSDPTAGVTDPTSGASTTPAVTSLESSKLAGAGGSGSGKSIIDGGSSKTTSTGGKAITMDTGTAEAAKANSGLSTNGGAYQDAFTGYGKNGTTPGNFGSSGASSLGPSGSGAGSGGSAGSGENGRDTASGKHSPAEEEALSSFGGGALSFNGGGGSSSSHSSSGDEPVKDFLQGAENALSDGEFADQEQQIEPALENGIEGEDGMELFRRVRSALERSQRKGSVMSGLSGPRDPRFR